MSKRWERWEIGYFGKKGYWVKITTISARDAEMAKIKGHTALCRPGRHNEYCMWKGGGCEVLECQ